MNGQPMPPLAEHFASYAQNVIPVGAPEAQMTECRRAFYAGAQAAFSVFYHAGDKGVSEEAGMRRIEALKTELQSFVNQVIAGKA